MPIAYTVAIDYDDDGDYDDAGEDITTDALELAWRLGMSEPYDSVSAPSTARVTVRNAARDYSPEFTADPLLPGKPLRIQSNDGVTVRTHFSGFVSHVEPLPGDQGQRTAVIHARGPQHELSQSQVRLPLQINVRADQVLAQILLAVPLRRVQLKGYAILGVAGHNELGTNTRLFGDNIIRSFEAGKSTFAYVADTWQNGIPAGSAIRQLVEAERGRFFSNRIGQAVFYNRHHTLLDTASDATFDDDMDGLDYTYGAQVINSVQVTVIPRSIGVPGTVLWELDNAQRIEPGEAGIRRLLARYRDDNARPIGALAAIRPQPGLDYQANTQPDGTGTDKTALVEVLLPTVEASAATLELRNNDSSTAYLQPGAKLRGTPLYLGDPVTLAQTDSVSVTFHGLNVLTLHLPALDSLEDAEQLARYELARRKDPQGVVRSLTLTSPTHTTQILARTLFDPITVKEAQTDHDAPYFIIAEDHHVYLGGTRHRVTWLLERAADDHFVIIGTSKPDGSRVLAY